MKPSPMISVIIPSYNASERLVTAIRSVQAQTSDDWEIIVIDDRFLRIGSANLNNRSMGADTECDLSIEATNGQQRAAIAGGAARGSAAAWNTVPHFGQTIGSLLRS